MIDYSNCTLCARECGINRYSAKAPCGCGGELKIAGYGLHFYEEPSVSGDKGSGTVFFAGCSLNCRFCQNYQISKKECGKTYSASELANLFAQIERMGAHNINIVNPTHFVPTLIEAVNIRKPLIPLVYNTHGYDSEQTIQALNGIADVYLTDIKYYNDLYAVKYSSAKNYFNNALKAVKIMCGQVKNRYEGKLIKSGVIIRHLILPGMTSDSIKILQMIKQELPSNVSVSLMAQYTPCGDLSKYPQLNRAITRREYDRVADKMLSLGIDGYIQSLTSSGKTFIPKWNLL